MNVYQGIFKVLFDLIVSLILIIILFPLLLAITLIILVSERNNPFFIQTRPGKDREIFMLVKFRTMNNKRDASGNLLPDSDRITPVGQWLRKLSLDEIPQLFNVLNGDMSLVGPRPLLTEYLQLYNEKQNRRHQVKPGITGWAQVNGRNNQSWEERFEYDVWYVDNISFTLDVRILFLTIFRVLKREGINQEGEATMVKFKGNN